MNGDLFAGLQVLPDAAGAVMSNEPLACTVSQVNALARELLEGALPPLWVEGEVTGWKRYPSGHCYFTLRDRDAQLRCVMFRNEAKRLPADPGEGMEVRALGGLSIYEKRGEFQFIARDLDARSVGGLWRIAFDKLVAKLGAEGLLAPERKRPIPRFPARVGIVTSPVGAALHDILTVIERRAPWTRVVFSPARVQGDGAATDIARALARFAVAGNVDVIIVGRGGGSAEDLWAFNEEIVARAIISSPVPVIAAVGHEVDVTIADLVADLRAATPSAAAERAVPDGAVLQRQLAGTGVALAGGLRRFVSDRRGELTQLDESMRDAMHQHLRSRAQRLAAVGGRLDALSPLGTLARGFAVPLSASGQVKRRTADFDVGERIRLRVTDGSVSCRVDEVLVDGA